MAVSDTNEWQTRIAKVGRDDVNVRGERLTELIGHTSFAEMMHLVLTGHRATPGQARVLDGLLVSVMEHGISPSSVVARMLASYGVPIQAGIAAGVLTIGDVHGGAGQQLASTLAAVVDELVEQGNLNDNALRDRARQLVADSRANRTPMEGFGHPQHAGDPRAPILLDLAREEGVYSHHCTLLTYLEEELATAIGRQIPANIDGASAALLLDLGFEPTAARIFLIAPRTVGLAAHYLEELDQGNVWRHVPTEQVTYTGPAFRGE